MVVMLIASLYWFSLGNIFSVRMPRAMDPEKMNQMANKMQALSIWTAPFLLLPIGLAYWARAVFESEIVFSGVLLIAAVDWCDLLQSGTGFGRRAPPTAAGNRC